MKALIVPSKGSGYELRDVEEPKRMPGELKIRVLRAALCYRDLLQLAGFYPRMKYPVILGHEVVGEVVESDGMFRKGEKVVSTLYAFDGICRFCKEGDEAHCVNKLGYSEELDGFFAQYAILKSESAVRVPENASDEEAVVAPCVTGMILSGLRRAGLKHGESVLVTGAGGGVGIHAVQVASALGARVIGVTSDEAKVDKIAKFCSSVVVGPKFAEKVKKEEGEVDVVIDTVGTPTLEDSLKSLRAGGRLLQVGNVEPTTKYELRLGYVILKDLQVIGHASANRKDVQDAMELSAQGKVRAVIAGTYKLEETSSAFAALKSRERVGKVLFSP